MDLGLKDKVAFIAASSQGLGKAVALELVQEGAKVIINGRTKETLEATKQEIKVIAGDKVFAIAGDLSIAGEREKIINTALQSYGAIDILVTNTGGPRSGKFESVSEDDWNAAYKSLLSSTVGLINGFQITQAIHVASTLRIADHLHPFDGVAVKLFHDGDVRH